MPESAPKLSVIVLNTEQLAGLNRVLELINQDENKNLLARVFVPSNSGLEQISVDELDLDRTEIVAQNNPLKTTDFREVLLDALDRVSTPFVTIFLTDEPLGLLNLGSTVEQLAPDTIVVGPSSEDPSRIDNAATWANSLSNKFVDRDSLRATLEFETESLTKEPHSIQLLWAALLAIYAPNVKRMGTTANAGQSPAAESVSDNQADADGKLDPNFSPEKSIDFLKRIEELRRYCPPSHRSELDLLAVEELRALNLWLRENPSRQAQVAEEIESWAHVGYPFSVLNQGLGKTLVISYAFAPDRDTSGMVVARRLRAWQKVVSVISNDLSIKKKYDPESFQLCAPFVERRIQLDATSTISGWYRISSFVEKGLNYIDQNPDWFSQHDHLYSRTMFPAAHFLAAMIKLRNPEMYWTAEFSDVMSTDTRNRPRHSPVKPDAKGDLYEQFTTVFEQAGLQAYVGDNVYLWSEILPYILADEIVFVSDRHREFMLELITDQPLRESVAAKSRIENHPTTPDRFYEVAQSPIELDPNKVNIGFIGNFYAIRRLAEVSQALALLPDEQRKRLAVHVISPNAERILNSLDINPDETGLTFHPPATYFECLAMQRQFDSVIINDMVTEGTFPYNFYTASKYYDFRPGESKIWGIVEPGSLLDSVEVQYKSRLGDTHGALKVLQQILAEADDEN